MKLKIFDVSVEQLAHDLTLLQIAHSIDSKEGETTRGVYDHYLKMYGAFKKMIEDDIKA